MGWKFLRRRDVTGEKKKEQKQNKVLYISVIISESLQKKKLSAAGTFDCFI